MSESRQQLLGLLCNGQFHSGEQLAAELAISRAAVWKQIQVLQAAGLKIESVHGKGYRLLTQLELLNSKKITSELKRLNTGAVKLSIFEELDSTNQYLMQLRDEELPHACLAETQSQGRGRRGRAWQSPYATTLALSLKWRFAADASRLAGLSLAVGVVVAECLEQLGLPDVQLKWPNDVLYKDQKLGGILIELSGDAAGPCDIVLGIGLNVSNSLSAAADMQQVEQAWVDLFSAMRVLPSRNQLAALLISRLLVMLEQFSRDGFETFRSKFQRRDRLWQCEVMVDHPAGAYHGLACGVDEQGALQVQRGDTISPVTAGEVSVRAKQVSR